MVQILDEFVTFYMLSEAFCQKAAWKLLDKKSSWPGISDRYLLSGEGLNIVPCHGQTYQLCQEVSAQCVSLSTLDIHSEHLFSKSNMRAMFHMT